MAAPSSPPFNPFALDELSAAAGGGLPPFVATPPAQPAKPPEASKPANEQQKPPDPPPPRATVAEVNQMYSSVAQAINANVRPNLLNKYYQTTYHFRLFVLEDRDVFDRTGTTSVSQLYSAIDGWPQITIAETGVTGYNIKEVRIKSQPSGNSVTRMQAALTFDMVVTEANGISFMDGFVMAAEKLKLKNFALATYYLELSFMGYDETGKFTGHLADKDCQGRWIWALTPTTVEVKLNESGGTYNLKFMTNESSHMVDNTNLLRIPEKLTIKGDTVKALLKDFVDKLNTTWNKVNNGELFKFEPIITHKIGSTLANPASLAGKDPGDFRLKAQEQDKASKKNWELSGNTYTVTLNDSTTVSDFITDLINHTEEGQNLVKDDSNVNAQTDQSAATTNDKKFRQSIFWTIEPIIKNTAFDTTSHKYIKGIEIHITPQVSQQGISSNVQVENAKSPEVQKNMVQALLDNKILNKKYEYIFTGLNTEILDFNMGFDLTWAALMPDYGGAFNKIDASEVHARQSSLSKSPEAGLSQNTAKVQTTQLEGGSTASSGPPASNTATAGSPASKQEVTKRPNRYVEDLLTGTDSVPDDFVLPISLGVGQREIANNAPNQSFVSQPDRDESIVAAIFTQVIDINAFAVVTMTVRGDPFWLGQTNLHRVVQLKSNQLSPMAVGEMDVNGGNQHIYLHFRYPIRMGDDFTPSFKDSPIFNGIYAITEITHTFVDGEFKQEITNAQRIQQIDTTKWTGAMAGKSGAGSSAALAKSTPPPTGGKAQGSMGQNYDEKAPKVVDRLMADFRLTREQASGLVGTMGYESDGLQPIQEKGVKPGQRGGFGWAQWTDTRRQNFDNYVAQNNLDPKSDETQYSFLKYELADSQNKTIQRLRNTSTVEEATQVATRYYEAPDRDKAAESMPERIAYAQKAFSLSTARANQDGVS